MSLSAIKIRRPDRTTLFHLKPSYCRTKSSSLRVESRDGQWNADSLVTARSHNCSFDTLSHFPTIGMRPPLWPIVQLPVPRCRQCTCRTPIHRLPLSATPHRARVTRPLSYGAGVDSIHSNECTMSRRRDRQGTALRDSAKLRHIGAPEAESVACFVLQCQAP